jgi:L-lactate dehydrogenase complex protein LldG
MATSREIILQKISQALATKSVKQVPEPDFTSPLYHSSEPDDLIVAFAENLIKTKAEFIYCEDRHQFIDEINRFYSERGLQDIFVWENGAINLLYGSKVKYSITDTNFQQAQVGITLCESIIARTGSILVTSKQLAGRRLSIYPPVHIVLGFTSQVVPDIKDALQQVKDKYADSMPSMISMITGPSRTADIEKTLVLGAHGPKELIIFLIDDSTF